MDTNVMTRPAQPAPAQATVVWPGADPGAGTLIDRAMVLAAGRGARLRPLTDHVPKPLIEIGGRPLIDHVLERLERAGVSEIVVNSHHLAPRLEAHLAARRHPRIQIARESRLLETGGAVANALPMLGQEPFYVVNSDALWLDGPTLALRRLAAAWDPERMDALLLVMPTVKAVGMADDGDFFVDALGRLRRRRYGEIGPYCYAGVQVTHAALFREAPQGAFSLNLVWDRAIEAGRLWGLVHDGALFHVGTAEGLALTRASLAEDQVRWVQS